MLEQQHKKAGSPESQCSRDQALEQLDWAKEKVNHALAALARVSEGCRLLPLQARQEPSISCRKNTGAVPESCIGTMPRLLFS
jgi:hypothetical protein